MLDGDPKREEPWAVVPLLLLWAVEPHQRQWSAERGQREWGHLPSQSGEAAPSFPLKGPAVLISLGGMEKGQP